MNIENTKIRQANGVERADIKALISVAMQEIKSLGGEPFEPMSTVTINGSAENGTIVILWPDTADSDDVFDKILAAKKANKLAHVIFESVNTEQRFRASLQED